MNDRFKVEPAKPKNPPPPKVPGWRQPWDPWRITMFAGALVLLAASLANGFTRGDLPDWLRISTQVIGWALLAVGFTLAMRKRRDLREEQKEKKIGKTG